MIHYSIGNDETIAIQPNSQKRDLDRLWSYVLGTVFALLYCVTAAKTLPPGDAGMYSTIYAAGGHGHPPGYPLFSLYLRAMSWLPVESAALGASLATALLGSVSVGVLCLAGKSWGFDRYSSAIGAIVFGLSGLVWYFHTKPDVFALNHLLASCILWVSGPRGPLEGSKRVGALGLLAGLGASNHHAIIFLAPIGFTGVWFGCKEARVGWWSLGWGVPAFVLGLLPYSYLVWLGFANIDYAMGWQWGDPSSWSDLVEIFFRRDYGTFKMASTDQPLRPLDQIQFLFDTSFRDMFAVGLPLAALGLCAGWGSSFTGDDSPNHGRLEHPCLWATATFATLLLCGPLFVSLINLDPRENTHYLYVRKMHLLFELVVAFAAIGGVFWLRRYLATRFKECVAAVLVVAAGVFSAVPFIAKHRSSIVEEYTRHVFGTLPEKAIVFGKSDRHGIAHMYADRALTMGLDVTFVQISLLGNEPYRKAKTAELDFEFPISDGTLNASKLLLRATRTGRPVFATGQISEGVIDKWPSIPWGPWYRLLPPDASMPGVDKIFELNRRIGKKSRVPVDADPPRYSVDRMLLKEYARNWNTLKRLMLENEKPRKAEAAHIEAYLHAPWIFDYPLDANQHDE